MKLHKTEIDKTFALEVLGKFEPFLLCFLVFIIFALNLQCCSKYILFIGGNYKSYAEKRPNGGGTVDEEETTENMLLMVML